MLTCWTFAFPETASGCRSTIIWRWWTSWNNPWRLGKMSPRESKTSSFFAGFHFGQRVLFLPAPWFLKKNNQNRSVESVEGGWTHKIRLVRTNKRPVATRPFRKPGKWSRFAQLMTAPVKCFSCLRSDQLFLESLPFWGHVFLFVAKKYPSELTVTTFTPDKRLVFPRLFRINHRAFPSPNSAPFGTRCSLHRPRFFQWILPRKLNNILISPPKQNGWFGRLLETFETRGQCITTNPNNALLKGKSLKFTIHMHCLILPNK